MQINWHRTIVRRTHPGLGAYILDWASAKRQKTLALFQRRTSDDDARTVDGSWLRAAAG